MANLPLLPNLLRWPDLDALNPYYALSCDDGCSDAPSPASLTSLVSSPSISSHHYSRLPTPAAAEVMAAPPEAGGGARKRKSRAKGAAEETSAKRCRAAADDDEAAATKGGGEQQSPCSSLHRSGKKGKESGGDGKQQPPEPPKDYIHVRARRGQATDSHSLAERVRREKISERMKLLQDLVPGCNKVIGKAVMLDEIINYVQSLQRQVEFLSMKLATVNPGLDVTPANFLHKDVAQSCGAQMPLPAQPAATADYSTGAASSALSFSTGAGAGSSGLGMLLPSLDGLGCTDTQIGNFWEDDLHRVVHMSYGQPPENPLFGSTPMNDVGRR